ncbi:hypothetical protein NL676_029114 [Syzygium grande]|nr:hypothetical protein NL676_029114 [Syzygium grande]
MAALAQAYGPLLHLRLGLVDMAVAASGSVAAQFLKTHDANFLSRPPHSALKHLGYNYQDMVSAPYGPRWRMLRKISSVHLFSSKALDDHRHEEVGILTRALAHMGSASANLLQLLNVCTANTLGRVMLGKRIFRDGKGRADPKADEFKSMVVEAAMVLAGVFNISDFVLALKWLNLQGVVAKMKMLHRRFDTFLTAIVEEHKANMGNSGNKHNDFLSTLISLPDIADEEGRNLTDTEIKALLQNMFAAGTDISSSTTEWAIAKPIRQPRILARVQEEINSVPSGSTIPPLYPSHESQPRAVRSMALPHPQRTMPLVNVWTIARDPDAWAHPDVFRPERFLPDGKKPDADIKGNHCGVIPFGARRRICVGMSLGLRMVRLMTATLAHAFNWESADGVSPEKLNMDEAYGLTHHTTSRAFVSPPETKTRLTCLRGIELKS